jgi:HK97 family phage major capsid protein
MVLLREEEQVLNGSGSGADLRGIRQTVGLQTQTAVAGDFSATLGRAIGKIETVDGEADGIALNPTDFWTMVTTRFANQFDGEAIGGSPFGAPPRTVWGLPAARTRSMASGTSLVGAFGMGAQLFTRQGVTIKTSDSHSTFFVENKIVILAEERVALAVYRPDWFVETTLA